MRSLAELQEQEAALNEILQREQTASIKLSKEIDRLEQNVQRLKAAIACAGGLPNLDCAYNCLRTDREGRDAFHKKLTEK